MRYAVAVVALSLLAACTAPLDLGFALAISLPIDSSVSDAEVATITAYSFHVTDGETFDTVVQVQGASTRDETVVYHPAATTTMLALTVVATDGKGVTIAEGMSGDLQLKPGKTVKITIPLSRPSTLDAGVPDGAPPDAREHDGGPEGDGGDVALTLELEGAYTVTGSGAMPSSIAIGDFNEDGAGDVLSLNFVGGELDLFPGKTNRTLGARFTTVNTVNLPLLAIGDFNGDHHLDAVAADVQGNMTAIHLWNGNGTYHLTPLVGFNASVMVNAIVTADLDKDGATDFVFMGPNATEVLYGSTSNMYTSTTTIPASQAQTAIAIGDVNGDGYLDIVTLEPSTYSVQINLNGQASAARTFGMAHTVVVQPAMKAALVGLAVGDMDDDGFADIAVSTTASEVDFCGGEAGGSCNVLAQASLLVRDQIQLVDFDGDHHADLIMTHDNALHTQGVGVALYAASGPTFAEETIYPTAFMPDALALGDIDNDGHIDIAVANHGSQSDSVVFNTTPPTTPLSIWAPLVATQVTQPMVADVNGDTVPDVVLGEVGGTGIDILLGKGDGTFKPGTRLVVTSGDIIGNVAVADINDDGFPDVIVTGKGSTDVFAGHAMGLFGSPIRSQLSTSVVTTGLAVGDIDGDGKLDLAYVIAGDTSLYVLFGNRTASFINSVVPLAVDGMFEPSSVAIGDLDGDKLPDIVASSAGHNGVVVFLHVTVRTFENAAVQSSLLTGASVVRLRDMNADGKLDLLIAGTGGLFVVPGLGTGQFGVANKLVSTSEVDDVLAVDLTNDGRPDVLAVSATTNQLYAWQSLGGDMFGTQQTYSVGALPNGLAVGDFDKDNKIDVVAGSLQTGVSRVRNISH